MAVVKGWARSGSQHRNMNAAESVDTNKRRLIAVSGPGGGGESEEAGGGVLMVQSLGLPVIEDGRLKNYVFVRLKLHLSAGNSPGELRTKEAYLRDALVRAAHRRPFTVSGDLTQLNERMLLAATQAAANSLCGEGVVTQVELVGQTPRRRTGLGPT